MLRERRKAIFFDWDGTAVRSRKTQPEDAVNAMKPLLAQGVKLIIVSGTTMDQIAGGQIESYFTVEELKHLYLGLGRGAYNYAFDSYGKPFIFEECIPSMQDLIRIHSLCFDLHKELLGRYGLPTDIIFSRPNYCKIDLLASCQRGDQLFLQEHELTILKESLSCHGITGGITQLLELTKQLGQRYGLPIVVTCDAKYLEAGISSKSNNVDVILERLKREFGISAEDCSFWGDEYVGMDVGIYGSDSFMMTDQSRLGDFYDVSEVCGERPQGVVRLGGGVDRFLEYLRDQVGQHQPGSGF